MSAFDYDIAICYFGLPRSVQFVFKSHIEFIYNVLDEKKITYKKFMHTWKTGDGSQRVWRYKTREKINYEEYKLLEPHYYKIESQDEFMETINMNDYYYEQERKKEWDRTLLKNHICALGSEKRVFEMVKESGLKFKYVMVIRPDSKFEMNIPIDKMLDLKEKEFSISDHRHYEGYNDRFMISNFNDAHIYLNRIDEMKEGRSVSGRITAEKYLKYTLKKHSCIVKKVRFPFQLIRPDGVESPN